jgi:hypothetical protein
MGGPTMMSSSGGGGTGIHPGDSFRSSWLLMNGHAINAAATRANKLQESSFKSPRGAVNLK